MLATGHILLTKQDTSASIGWIGTVCLAPFFGVCLYLMFGINRVRRLARKLVQTRAPQDETAPVVRWGEAVDGAFRPLSEMVRKISGRPLLGGNTVEPLIDGENAYPIMLAAIHAAEKSVMLSSYIFRKDRTGALFIDALIAAHQRGVAVRVLLDGVGTGYFYCPAAKTMRAAGVPSERFLHSLLPWRMPFINLRNHRKILVTDGETGFIGGLNIGDENRSFISIDKRVGDMHFRVCGPVVRQLAEAFAWDWSFTCGEELAGPTWFPPLTMKGGEVLRVVTAGPDTDLEKIEYTLLQAITLARQTIRIMTPYFMPGTRILSELALAALRGVQVELVIPARSNHRVMDWAGRDDLRPLLDAGCRVWSSGPPFNHAKLMVVDRQWTFIGSSNLDARSLRLNFEINVESYGAAFASQIDDFILGHRKHRLTHHTLDERSLPIRLRDATARLFSPYL
ncbi:cardiolipin synthase [Acetobacter sp. LMG 1627]|uniref:Phospholipase D n=1 Tax=Acetobacter conturbans TaxID=1737472 RepID=A0ABX0K2K2_9PROT|nr:cardiolipin synthase [Acetobacter conturbans]